MDKDNVPYIVYESTLARHERTVKRLILALILSIFLIFASNACWLYAWCQYDYESTETTTVKQDNADANIYGDGNTVNGSNDSDKKAKTQTQKKGKK